MPIYEFQCTPCRTVFSFFSRRVDTTTVPVCPRCGRALSREVSAVAYLSGGAGDGAMPDEGRMASAMEAMGDELEGIGEGGDAQEAAEALDSFSDASGLRFNRDVREAVERIASGEDADAVGAELETLLADGASPFEQEGGASQKRAPQGGAFRKDPTLYDL